MCYKPHFPLGKQQTLQLWSELFYKSWHYTEHIDHEMLTTTSHLTSRIDSSRLRHLNSLPDIYMPKLFQLVPPTKFIWYFLAGNVIGLGLIMVSSMQNRRYVANQQTFQRDTQCWSVHPLGNHFACLSVYTIISIEGCQYLKKKWRNVPILPISILIIYCSPFE